MIALLEQLTQQLSRYTEVGRQKILDRPRLKLWCQGQRLIWKAPQQEYLICISYTRTKTNTNALRTTQTEEKYHKKILCVCVCVCQSVMCANMCPLLFCRNRALDPPIQSWGHRRLFTADLWPRPERTNCGRKVTVTSSITAWHLIRTQSMGLSIRMRVWLSEVLSVCLPSLTFI